MDSLAAVGPEAIITIAATIGGLLATVAVTGTWFNRLLERQSTRTRRLLTERVKNGDLVEVSEGRRRPPKSSTTRQGPESDSSDEESGHAEKRPGEHTDAASSPASSVFPAAEDADTSLLREYYTQGISQSKVSFVASLVAASLGFLLIVVACLRAIFPAPGADVALGSVVTLVAGALVEAVAALFFTQSNRARVLMSDMHDRLRTDRKADREFDKAMSLVEEVSTPVIKDQLKVEVARHFIGLRGSGAGATNEGGGATEA